MEQLATQCPKCSTQFRVTMAQLELREGKVRCGACREIFNGIDHVFEYTGEEGFTLTPPAVEQDLADRMTLIDFGSLRGAPENSAPSMQEELDALSRAIADLQSKPWAEPPATPRSEFGDEDADEDADAGHGQDAALATAPAIAAPEQVAEAPGFVQQARSRERSARVWKVLLWVGIPLLLMALAAQLAYFFRSEIAARSPETARYLRAACRRLDCTVGLPKHIDQLSLAASRLEQPPAPEGSADAATEHAAPLTLVALLQNKSDTVQAWPSLDLKLKDADGTTVVRKAFLPDAYLKTKEIRDGMPAHSEREIRIAFELAGAAPAGFDLTIFYH